jgi:hypothetical protein
LIVDPDKLQSEEFQIKKQSLELIREKGVTFPIHPTSIDSIANPEFSKLSEGELGDKNIA